MRRKRWRTADDPAVLAAEMVLYQGLYDARTQVAAGALACPGCGLSTVDADGATSRWARIVCDGCGAGLFVGVFEGLTWAIDRRLGRFRRSDGQTGVAYEFRLHRHRGVPYGTVDHYLLDELTPPPGPAPAPPESEASAVAFLNPANPTDDPTTRRFSLLEIE
jgi:hypothetical protein